MSDSAVIKIDDHAAVSASVPVRQLVYLVLLLAIKDRATEVQFEPSPQHGEWKLRYRIGGAWYEMAPIPLDVPVSQEIRRLTGLGLTHRLLTSLRRLARGGAAHEKHVRLLVAGRPMKVGITIDPARAGVPGRAEAVALRLPEREIPTEEARRILMEYLQRRPPTESSSSRA